MRLNIEARHGSSAEALTEYVEKKVETLSRYFDKILKLDVVLEVEGATQRVQMTGYLVNHKVVKAVVETNDMYASVDQAVDKMQRQVVRYKERLRVARKIGHSESAKPRRTCPGPRIEIADDYMAKVLTVEEAAHELQESGRHFLVFIHAPDDQPAVLFRREDGTYSLVLPRP